MEQILVASGELIASFDSGEMVRQARILAQSTAELIQAIKGEAETQSDSELQASIWCIYLILQRSFWPNFEYKFCVTIDFFSAVFVKYFEKS